MEVEQRFRGWSLRKVAEAAGIPVATLHKYARMYTNIPVSPAAPKVIRLLGRDDVREVILIATLLPLSPTDAPVYDALIDLRARLGAGDDLDHLAIVLAGGQCLLCDERVLGQQLTRLVNSTTDPVVGFRLGQRHQEVMKRLCERKPRAQEKA